MEMIRGQARGCRQEVRSQSSVKNPDSPDFEVFPGAGESLHLQEGGGCRLDFLQIDRGVWS
jgi:hypothetical protein